MIDDLSKHILIGAGEKTNDLNKITYSSIVSGSTIVTGSLDSSLSYSTTINNLRTTFSSGNLGLFTLTSYSITGY